MECKWIRKPKNDTVVIFIHGILSSGERCWQHENGTYWPQLLEDDSEVNDVGIYVYSYKSGLFSGTYSLSDVVDDLKERIFNIDHVSNHNKIVFVCHSMGGIIARKLIIERENDLRNKRIGLFLVASPSLGSSYATWLEPIAKFMGHSQADVLKFAQNNIWLNDLDKSFLNLKDAGRLNMCGKELIEDNFVIFEKIYSKQVVEYFSGVRYFGEPYKVPNSDHFSIAKPKNRTEIQHLLLRVFINQNFLSVPDLATKDDHKPYAKNFFNEVYTRPSEAFNKCIKNAKELCIMGLGQNRMFRTYGEDYRLLLERGGVIKFALIDPDSPAMQMSTKRGGFKECPIKDREVHYNTKSRISDLARLPSGTVKLKYYNLLLPFTAYFFDIDSDNAVAFIWNTPLFMSSKYRPGFRLERKHDSLWFDRYKLQWDNLWKWEEAKEIPLK